MKSNVFRPNFNCGPCMHCNMYSENQPDKFLNCELCKRCVHLNCLQTKLPCKRILGDNFFTFTCKHCSQSNSEHIQRANMTVMQCMLLAFYNLLQKDADSGSSDGFYHYNTHIFSFIRQNWKDLFCYDGVNFYRDKKKFKCGCLSGLMSNSPLFAPKKKGERGGYYRLVEAASPAYLLHKYFHKGENRSRGFDRSVLKANDLEAPITPIVESSSSLTERKTMTDSTAFGCSDELSRSSSSTSQGDQDNDELPTAEFSYESQTSKKEGRRTSCLGRVSLFNHSECALNEEENHNKRLIVPLSRYEEEQLLRVLEREPEEDLSQELRQMRRKIKVRQNHLEHNKPVFDIDREVSFLETNGRIMTASERRALCDSVSTNSRSRILDRFQVCKKTFGVSRKAKMSFYSKLVGLSSSDALTTIHSPYSLRELKPFIFRDSTTRPLKLRLLAEIVARFHQRNKHCNHLGTAESLYSRHSIDFCYVTEKHIFAINQLVREFFWPGIDVSEVLQYPDFTCVASFRRLVVGFGVVVPDASLNEAYLSFLVVHPEWRRAGIAKFILYHLIQMCPEKDITLHVSATNPAMIMYQQFGFKVEEFLTDFYEKYLPLDSRECRHALLLRLRR